MKPIRLLGLHQVGLIGHHVELKRQHGEPSGHQVEMGGPGVRDQACLIDSKLVLVRLC